MERKIITTSDGSHSLFVPELDEHYHSTHGAIQEAKHVFLKAGLDGLLERLSEISVLEVGLGTGLNAFLTWMHVQKTDIKVQYTALEAFPVDFEMAQRLNYVSELTGEQSHPIFDGIHSSVWEQAIALDNTFTLLKKEVKLQDFNPTEGYDIIYFDAFGPPVQPAMWTPEIFQKLYDCLNPNGIFVTYCAKGQVRRDLQSVGFQLERLPGPPGKREMLRGIKQ
jgi:tRNA U34 5-methylaminomethyl-2-thiouridine-forming methyltransferase MnmC